MKMGNMVTRLLRKNLSKAQIIGFTLSNLVGLAIVVAGLQLFVDVYPIWDNEDSFIRKDYLVVNKRVDSVQYGDNVSDFTDEDIAALEQQPWVRSVGRFSTASFPVYGSVASPGQRHALSTYMFFEAIPKEYIDVPKSQWHFEEGSTEVPIIISKDYLALYNFGFAATAGLPQISENVLGSVPLQLSLQSEDGNSAMAMRGRIVGFSNRLNTILVPQEFLDWANLRFGDGSRILPKRLIIDVSSPGDVAIAKYMDDHGWEIAGDKSSSQASFFINVITGVVVGVGLLVTVLSFFILFLSISLLMQKNKEKLRSLIMLGYPLKEVGRPYRHLIILVSVIAFLLALVMMVVLRSMYITSVEGMGGGGHSVYLSVGVGLLLTLLTILFNVVAVNRRVKDSFWR